MNCRHCNTPLTREFVDLRTAPPSNSLVSRQQLANPEVYFPLKVMVCTACWLVQLPEHKSATEIFSADYAYFSSYSSHWLDHARRYTDMICERLELTSASFVVEVASNDGYLLQNFKAREIPCLGIEPSRSTSRVARERGIDVIEDFFGERLAARLVGERRRADLIIGNNVLAHVPDINDFVRGIAALLADDGSVTLEFPHLLNLIQASQFDTIYHEHFSYLSLSVVERIANTHGLAVYDVERLDTHGGSLRVYLCKDRRRLPSEAVLEIRAAEGHAGLLSETGYVGFQRTVDRIALDFISFLVECGRKGYSVMGYGAAAKASTLLNYAGISRALLPAIADASPHKQGRFVPGVRIPIVTPETIREMKPDYVVVFPWNLIDEIREGLAYVRSWGGKFVTAIPSMHVE